MEWNESKWNGWRMKIMNDLRKTETVANSVNLFFFFKSRIANIQLKVTIKRKEKWIRGHKNWLPLSFAFAFLDLFVSWFVFLFFFISFWFWLGIKKLVYSFRKLSVNNCDGPAASVLATKSLTIYAFFFLHFDGVINGGRGFGWHRCGYRHDNGTIRSGKAKVAIASIHVGANLKQTNADQLVITIDSSGCLNCRFGINAMYWLTPWPEHSTLSLFVGHFVWSMYGNRLTQVWLTQIKLLPQGVPSSTKPYSKSRDVGDPLVVLKTHQVLWLICRRQREWYKKKQQLSETQQNCSTHLHSYSAPLIDMIVLELMWFWSSGWRSPSLHCNEPHLTFLRRKATKNKTKKREKIHFICVYRPSIFIIS